MAFGDWLLSLSITFSTVTMLQLVSIPHSFLWLTHIPLYGWCMFLSVDLSMGISSVSTVWLL